MVQLAAAVQFFTTDGHICVSEIVNVIEIILVTNLL